MIRRVGTRANPIVIELETGFTADDLVQAVRKYFPTIEGLHKIPNESFVMMKNVGIHGNLDSGAKKPSPKAKKATKKGIKK